MRASYWQIVVAFSDGRRPVMMYQLKAISSQDMTSGLEKIRDLEDSSRMTRHVKEEELTKQAPTFTKPLENIEGLKEGENVHFEARLTPTNDPKLKVIVLQFNHTIQN